MPYLSALEVCSRRGAIQIHVYLTLPLLCAIDRCSEAVPAYIAGAAHDLRPLCRLAGRLSTVCHMFAFVAVKCRCDTAVSYLRLFNRYIFIIDL